MFEDMTFEAIQADALKRVNDELDKREGSVIWDATAAVSLSLEKVYFQLMNFLDLVFIDQSVGQYLDRIAAAYNMSRKLATKAIIKGIFNLPIPIGSRFTTIGEENLVFVAIENAGKTNQEYAYLMECNIAGKKGNNYTGTLLPVEYINGLTTAEVGELIAEGTDDETDEALKERLLNKIRRPSTSGNANDYYNWALECAGIGAAKVFPLASGPGTVKVVVADENKKAASTTLLKAVKEHIEELRPIGATVTVSSAREKIVNIGAKVRLSTGTNLGTIQNLFSDCASKYLSDNSFTADYISLARVGNLLLDITGVEDYTDLLLNGTGSNIVLAAEEIAIIGEVRLEVMQ